MPVFDPLVKRLIVRLVYDGPAMAGKTTNVQQICRTVPVRKRSELYTPGALKGRTMFFDWLEIDIGSLGKLPVRVQLLSVTGQESRSYRRRPLLRSADAVVFVCDSRPAELDQSKRRLQLLRRYLRERDTPVLYLVQANKQDLPGALPPDQLRARLGLRDSVTILPAAAASGRGVNETFQQAARMAARCAHALITQRGLASISGNAETADSLLDALLVLEDEVELPLSQSGERRSVSPGAREEAQALGV